MRPFFLSGEGLEWKMLKMSFLLWTCFSGPRAKAGHSIPILRVTEKAGRSAQVGARLVAPSVVTTTDDGGEMGTLSP